METLSSEKQNYEVFLGTNSGLGVPVVGGYLASHVMQLDEVFSIEKFNNKRTRLIIKVLFIGLTGLVLKLSVNREKHIQQLSTERLS